MKKFIPIFFLLPNFTLAETICNFDYLKNDLPAIYKKIVLKSNTIPKIFSFCDDQNHYLFNASMFQKFNNGQGINRALEKDLFSYLLNEFNATSYSRTSLMVRNDQQLELVTTIVNKSPFKAEEVIEEVFYNEESKPNVSYGESNTFIRPHSAFAGYFKDADLSKEDRAYLEKFKPFVGAQKLQ
tara:strand:+ start:70083 stop:70634 length:552 start_codon:yes stop_codon:yes gene_type:complete